MARHDRRGTGRRILHAEEWRLIGDDLDLTPRELQVVKHVFDGLTESAVGRRLGISEHTVHSHLRRVYRKLEVSSRCELLLHVLRHFLRVVDLPVPAASEEPPAPR